MLVFCKRMLAVLGFSDDEAGLRLVRMSCETFFLDKVEARSYNIITSFLM